MTDILVRTKKQFAQFAELRATGEPSKGTKFYIMEDLFVEFSDYAVTHARKTGFLFGVITALASVVVLGVVAKIVMWW